MLGYYPKLTPSYIIPGVRAVACRRYRPPLLGRWAGEQTPLVKTMRSDKLIGLMGSSPAGFEAPRRNRLPGESSISKCHARRSRGEAQTNRLSILRVVV